MMWLGRQQKPKLWGLVVVFPQLGAELASLGSKEGSQLCTIALS